MESQTGTVPFLIEGDPAPPTSARTVGDAVMPETEHFGIVRGTGSRCVAADGAEGLRWCGWPAPLEVSVFVAEGLTSAAELRR